MKRRRSPWWMCCGWRSPWCVLDTALHMLHIKWSAVCDRHDRRIMDEVPDGEDWLEALDGPSLMHHFDTLPKADVTIKRVDVPQAGVFLDFTTGKVTPMPQTWGSGTSTTIRYQP